MSGDTLHFPPFFTRTAVALFAPLCQVKLCCTSVEVNQFLGIARNPNFACACSVCGRREPPFLPALPLDPTEAFQVGRLFRWAPAMCTVRDRRKGFGKGTGLVVRCSCSFSAPASCPFFGERECACSST